MVNKEFWGEAPDFSDKDQNWYKIFIIIVVNIFTMKDMKKWGKI